jgi:RimJ/RimL family protein N-acetyltransferase
VVGVGQLIVDVIFEKERVLERLKLINNDSLDMTFLKNSLKSKEEMSLVNPSAAFPFEEEYWRNFYHMDDNPSYSLLLKKDDETIAHAALKQFPDRENHIFLCFVYLLETYRGKGYSKKLLIEVEAFLKKEFQASEYYLNVLIGNIPAFKCYENFGFKEISRSDESIRMKKVLE